MADWSPLAGRAAITVFNNHLSNFDDIVEPRHRYRWPRCEDWSMR
jgi:hypothetical protein